MDRVLVITGASRGIGAATARLAAQQGYSVCVNYRRSRDAADGVVRAIESRGGRAVAIAADVSVEADVTRLFQASDQLLGPLTALVNNAGVLETQMRVDEFNADRLTRIFATNVVGAFLCAREAVRRMSSKHGGRGGAIVNVSSAAARLGSPGEYVDYAASKGAIDTMTIGLAREVAEEGIRVNAVRAGFIYTEMHASGGERIASIASKRSCRCGVVELQTRSRMQRSGCFPMRRHTQPEVSSMLPADDDKNRCRLPVCERSVALALTSHEQDHRAVFGRRRTKVGLRRRHRTHPRLPQ